MQEVLGADRFPGGDTVDPVNINDNINDININDSNDNDDDDGHAPPAEEGADYFREADPPRPFPESGSAGAATRESQPSTAVSYPNLLSPFSGSVGVGVFRISRWYCLLSVLSAFLAVVVAPSPIDRLGHLVASGAHRARAAEDRNNNHNSNNHNHNSNHNYHLQVPSTQASVGTAIGVDELVARAAFLGIAASRHTDQRQGSLSPPHPGGADAEGGREPRKGRRRRPATERHGSDPEARKRGGDAGCMSRSEAKARDQDEPGTVERTDTNENENENKNENTYKNKYKYKNSHTKNDIRRLPLSWLKYWAEQTAEHAGEIESARNQKQNPKIPAERSVWWRGPFQKSKNARDDKAAGNNDAAIDGSCSSDGNGNGNGNGNSNGNGKGSSSSSTAPQDDKVGSKASREWQWIDPIFWTHDSLPGLVTSIIDKILKSTPRLCVVTNFMLTMTYLLHSAVAAWFLSHSAFPGGIGQSGTAQRQQGSPPDENPPVLVTDWSFANSSAATGARERMGGFLVFKLLLISAVVAPDTLDLLILLTWFTLLGCLRSLDHLAHSTNTHLVGRGLPPDKGVVRLLAWVLACDALAAGSCVALFHTAGPGMVLLLTCDCALLGADAAGHVLGYYKSLLDHKHGEAVRGLEERQLALHQTPDNHHNDNDSNHNDSNNNNNNNNNNGNESSAGEQERDAQEEPSRRLEVRQASERLDREMERLEVAHNRRVAILDRGVFALEMACHVLTVAHFCHIWSLNGVQFTLIDGVLALHLHSAISSACTKLARRRNVHNIARDLQGRFPNATDEELDKASAAGDVCCICLGSMTTGGSVKKLRCGHLYHTHCLREVIERAQNLRSARCPLCREPLLDRPQPPQGDPPPADAETDNARATVTANPEPPRAGGADPARRPAAEAGGGGGDPARGEGERALFRFSTEGILPVWVPVPAFSFEVVRRPPNGTQGAGPLRNEPAAAEPRPQAPGTGAGDLANALGRRQQHEHEPSFLQRVLALAGLVPMSPEEEARALEQLVDMFPQYDRQDLLGELRDRGSIEAVTESILMGIFRGVPRS